MKDSGKTIKPTEKEDSYMLTVMYTMGSGSMIKLMDLVSIAILMVLNTRVTGRKINNTVMDYKPG